MIGDPERIQPGRVGDTRALAQQPMLRSVMSIFMAGIIARRRRE